MICPDCKGEGKEIASHVSYSDGRCGFNVPLKCLRCDGSGAVDDSTPEWIEAGRRMRDARVNAKPYRNLSTEAKRRGMDVVTLSRMERGVIEPIQAKEAPCP
jgi:hypothetical protein